MITFSKSDQVQVRLTQHLLATGARVTAIELDDAPVLHLDEIFREEQNSKQFHSPS